MPIYEYVCADCGKIFESLRSMSQADALIACPKCGQEHTRRKPSVCYSETGRHASESSSGGGSCGSCSGGNCSGCGH